MIYGLGLVARFFSSNLTIPGSEGLNKEKTLPDLTVAQLALAKAIEKYQPDTSNSEMFRKLANGVFQAEGCVSAWFNGNSLTVSPVVNLGQNYSSESLAFFVRLYHELGKIGKLEVKLNTSQKVFITWHLTNWDLILSIVSKYFSFVYGEKLRAFQKLEDICKLKSRRAKDDDKVLLVKLVYSLTSAGKPRKLSQNEKLKSLNLVYSSPELEISYPYNPEAISFFFVLGFLLGDGSIYIRVRRSKSGALNFIPSIIFFQKSDANSKLIYGLLSGYLDSLGCKSIATAPNKAGMSILRVEGILAVASLIPLFKEYSSLGYWKSDSINMLLDFYKYHTAGAQTYLKGLNAVLDLLYKDPNNRIKTLEEWKIFNKEYFNSVESKYKSNFQFITPITKSKKYVGWIVIFSEKLTTVHGQKLTLKNKSFFFSSFTSESKALEAAIQYRDSVLFSHLKELIS